MSGSTRDIARGAMTNSLGILAGGIGIVFYIFTTRSFGAAVTGIFVLARSLVDIISKVSILGFDRGTLSTSARYIADDDSEGTHRTAAQTVFLGTITSLITLVMFEVLLVPALNAVYNNSTLVEPLRIMGLSLPFITLSAILLAATRSLRIMKYQVYVKNLIEPVFLFVISIVFFLLEMDVNGLCLAFLISSITGTVFSFYFFSREFDLKKISASLAVKTGMGDIFRFSAIIGIYDLLNLLQEKIDLFILNLFYGSAVVGIYGMAQNTAFTLKKIRQSFDPILIPVISASHHLEDRDDLLLQFRNVTRWILLLNCLFIGLFIFASESIMKIFGKNFSAGAFALVLLTSSVMVNTVFGVSELFILVKKPIINLINTVLTLAVVVSLNFILVPQYGMTGAGVSIVISYIFMNTLRILEVKRIFGIHPFTVFHLKIAVCCAASCAATWLARKASALPWSPGLDFVSVILFMTIYLGLLVLSGMADEEKSVLRRMTKKFHLYRE